MLSDFYTNIKLASSGAILFLFCGVVAFAVTECKYVLKKYKQHNNKITICTNSQDSTDSNNNLLETNEESVLTDKNIQRSENLQRQVFEADVEEIFELSEKLLFCEIPIVESVQKLQSEETNNDKPILKGESIKKQKRPKIKSIKQLSNHNQSLPVVPLGSIIEEELHTSTNKNQTNIHSIANKEIDMSLKSLPRELKLIIDDICNENNHLLEWEVFGNSTDDMRIVLTWRRLNEQKSQPRRASLGKWKLRQSSVNVDEAGEILEDDSLMSLHNKSGESWDTKQKGGSNGERSEEEEEIRKKRQQQKEEEIKAQEEEKRRRRKKEEEEERLRLEEEEEKKRLKKRRAEEIKRKDEMEAQAEEKRRRRKKEEEEERLRLEEEEEKERLKKRREEEKRQKEKEEEQKSLEEMKRRKEEMRRKEKEQAEKREREEREKRQKQEEEEERRNEEEERRKREEQEQERSRKIKEEDDSIRQEQEEKKRRQEEIRRKEEEEKEEEKEKKMRRSSSVNEREDDGNDESKSASTKKKKNPFRKVKKDEKNKTKGKLQLTLSIDEGKNDDDQYSNDDGSKVGGAIDEEDAKNDTGKNRLSKEEQELVERLLKDEANQENLEDARKKKDSDQKRKSTESDGLEYFNEDLETPQQKVKSKEAAKRMLEMQRNKFKMSIDEAAFDNLDVADMLPDKVSSVGTMDDIPEFSITDKTETKTEEKRRKEMLEKKQEKKKQSKVVDENLFRVKPLNGLILGKTGWERCMDCKFNGFCDDLVHKAEYLTILLNDVENDPSFDQGCSCYVCKSGAVHNGCVYRELLRLKTDYKLFDKRNLCFCKTCIPFKYRKMCLRQELRLLRSEGKDIYYRLTYHGEDGNEGYHPLDIQDDSLDSSYHSDEEQNMIDEKPIGAMSLDDFGLDIVKEDKIDFRNCIDCQFNGFCDNLRHKKLYLLLLRIDDEDFEDLEDECGCLVCEFGGAAHSGCVQRELKRLKYDLLLFDKRNLCMCHQCIPFKYRAVCLRQEMKLLRRNRGKNLYENL